MSGIYITGVEMPKENEHAYWFVLHTDGTVEYNKNQGEGWQTGKALSVHDHGRLIDKDVMCNECRRKAEEYDGIYPDCTYCPAHFAPTIIPASKEGDG